MVRPSHLLGQHRLRPSLSRINFATSLAYNPAVSRPFTTPHTPLAWFRARDPRSMNPMSQIYDHDAASRTALGNFIVQRMRKYDSMHNPTLPAASNKITEHFAAAYERAHQSRHRVITVALLSHILVDNNCPALIRIKALIRLGNVSKTVDEAKINHEEALALWGSMNRIMHEKDTAGRAQLLSLRGDLDQQRKVIEWMTKKAEKEKHLPPQPKKRTGAIEQGGGRLWSPWMGGRVCHKGDEVEAWVRGFPRLAHWREDQEWTDAEKDEGRKYAPKPFLRFSKPSRWW